MTDVPTSPPVRPTVDRNRAARTTLAPRAPLPAEAAAGSTPAADPGHDDADQP